MREMARFCYLVGLVFGSSSLSAEEALASHGERRQLPPAALQSSGGKKRGRKTAPEAADEHQEDGEVPPPVSKAAALLEKGKEKVSELNTYLRRGKDASGNPSDQNNTRKARSPMLKTAIGGIMSCVAIQRGRRIDILAFEVANTIAKASNLMASLSEQSTRHLKAVVIGTRGVQCLISDDQNQVLAHVGADIRQQFREFAADVARFGNVCRDPKWHNLDNNFSSMDYGLALPVGSGLGQFPPMEYSKEKAESKMKNLMWQAKEAAVSYSHIIWDLF
ncbi:hypothetical protein GUJ93_ZPchr0011g28004 [Zizania palustris]|uniref:DUF3475 domain-containing protein n=1 Tax=Zizania palustris TaxID=103762 RepID=A0A8J5WMD7_ZIZPA|nr:hypothetical protein GUJ93_ZPchr0011g28004 [Zizania palustris]